MGNNHDHKVLWSSYEWDLWSPEPTSVHQNASSDDNLARQHNRRW